MIRGRFITLEGIEGAGKSSLQRELVARLQAQGLRVCATREPGGTPLAEEIRQLVLKSRDQSVSPAAELLLMFAARAAHVSGLIGPALARGEWVICDRFTDASRAYQGGGRGLNALQIEQLAALAHPGLTPDLTFLLDLPPDIGLARAQGRGQGSDRFERETLEFFHRVRAKYLELAAAEPKRFVVIDATATPASVLEQALSRLAPL